MKKRILLADDDESVRTLVGRVLESAGYAVIQARAGEEAVSEVVASQPDLVILELRTANRAGWEPVESVQRLDPAMPIIATTSWANQAAEALDRGIDALIEKPLDLALLLSSIQRFLSESTARRNERRARGDFQRANSLVHAGRN